jgi:hypothetical protein
VTDMMLMGDDACMPGVYPRRASHLALWALCPLCPTSSATVHLQQQPGQALAGSPADAMSVVLAPTWVTGWSLLTSQLAGQEGGVP